MTLLYSTRFKQMAIFQTRVTVPWREECRAGRPTTRGFLPLSRRPFRFRGSAAACTLYLQVLMRCKHSVSVSRIRIVLTVFGIYYDQFLFIPDGSGPWVPLVFTNSEPNFSFQNKNEIFSVDNLLQKNSVRTNLQGRYQALQMCLQNFFK